MIFEDLIDPNFDLRDCPCLTNWYLDVIQDKGLKPALVTVK